METLADDPQNLSLLFCVQRGDAYASADDLNWYADDGSIVQDDPTARRMCQLVMWRYHMEPTVIRHINRNTIFTCADPNSDRGGGFAHFGYRGKKNWVQLLTAQKEAALHECAHIAWKELDHWPDFDKDAMIEVLMRNVWIQADMPHNEFPEARALCHVYKYGHGSWRGMCPDGYPDCNHDETFAGFASGLWGDMNKMPYALRPVFKKVFRSETVWLPSVSA